MFDGSRKPLAENIAETAQIAKLAHDNAISCEGEIGFVGYDNGEASAGTDPDEAAIFARDTGVDAMAVSVGNVHLQQNASDGLDEARIRAIEAVTDVPLVIHGGSGVPAAQRRALAQGSNICKFNIGTELRMAFGTALREAVHADPARPKKPLMTLSTPRKRMGSMTARCCWMANSRSRANSAAAALASRILRATIRSTGRL